MATTGSRNFIGAARLVCIAAVACAFAESVLHGQTAPAGSPGTPGEALPTSRLPRRPEAPKVTARLVEQMRPEQARIIVDLSDQRARLMMDDAVVIDAPISSGRAGGATPAGEFKVLQKEPNSRGVLYGDFVDEKGRTVRAGVSPRSDAAPSGTSFVPARIKNYLLISEDGIAIHEGELPGYPATDGSIRLAPDMAAMFHNKVQVGTPVIIIP